MSTAQASLFIVQYCLPKGQAGIQFDGFILNTLKTLFRLSRVLVDLYRCILSGTIKFVYAWSSYEK